MDLERDLSSYQSSFPVHRVSPLSLVFPPPPHQVSPSGWASVCRGLQEPWGGGPESEASLRLEGGGMEWTLLPCLCP